MLSEEQQKEQIKALDTAIKAMYNKYPELYDFDYLDLPVKYREILMPFYDIACNLLCMYGRTAQTENTIRLLKEARTNAMWCIMPLDEYLKYTKLSS